MKENMSPKVRKRIFKDDTVAVYTMIAPMLIGFILFTLYPIFWIIRYSVFEYDGFTKPIFVGAYNFIRVFTRDMNYWQSLGNSFILTIALVLIQVPLGLVIAVMIKNKSRANSFLRTAYFIPTIISTAIIGIIFSIMFSSFGGIINNILMNVGLIHAPIDWFAEKWHSMSVIIMAAIWSGIGITMIYFLMGLQSIPQELYECADIDGANHIQKFFKITVPMLAPILQIVLMLAIIDGMKMTDLILVLTNGMPGGKTEVVMTYTYKFFFGADGMNGATASQFGYASAMSVVTAVVVGLITLIYLKMSQKMKKIY